MYGNIWKAYYLDMDTDYENHGVILAKNANQAKVQWLAERKCEEFKQAHQPLTA
jgi:hypothetical protein